MKRLSALLTVLAMLLPITVPMAQAAGVDGINATIPPLLLAQADSADNAAPTAIVQALDQGEDPRSKLKRRWLTPNKLHQYMGIAALLLGGATALSSGLAEEDEGAAGGDDNGDGGVHGALAYAATAMATGAAASGFLYHREDIGFDKPINDPDNLHMLLTAAGVAGFVAATAMEGGDGHPVLGMLGGLSMLVGVKITW